MSKSILVTGGTKGIGRAIIERFGAEGFDVFTCARHLGIWRNLKSDFESQFPNQNIYIFPADLSKKEEVLAFSTFVKKIGIPDVIINNTGVFFPGSIHSEPEGNFETMMHTNLFSAYYLTRAFTPK
jgi:NAD(P)-dependent dehydrogenase (short-subunit alcohol dehydrogenase family)